MFYSDEKNLIQQQSAITDFYLQKFKKDFLITENGKLHYGYYIPPEAQAAIVISSGRIEALAKYQELLWELQHNQFAVFILDHQGQGLSYRHLANQHKGYVRQFSDYANDFATFDKQVVEQLWSGKKVLLGHSMGCAIAYDFLARFPHSYSGVFLSAPMFDIYTKGTPKPLAKLAAKVASICGFKQAYAFGQSNYLAHPFLNNDITSSEVRYTLFRELYQKEPKLQLGGVTYGWLNAVFQYIAKLSDLKVDIPLFIASAEHDTVVDNRAQIALTHRQKQARLKTYPNAKHELLFEQDTIRKAVLTDFYQFCEDALAVSPTTDSGSK